MLTYNKNLILYIKESDAFDKRRSFDQTDAKLVLAQTMQVVWDALTITWNKQKFFK